MDETLKLLPISFFNKIFKQWIHKHIKVISQLSKFVKRGKEKKLMEPMYVTGERGINIYIYVDFSKICHVSKSLLNSNKILE